MGTIAAACPNRLLRALDRTLAPARDARRHQLPEATGAAEHRRRALALQTGLGLAVARRDAAGASAWALELATLERVGGDVRHPPRTADDGFPATLTMPAAPAPFSPDSFPPAPFPSTAFPPAPHALASFERTPLSPAPRARLDGGGLETPPVTVPALLEAAAPTVPAARAAH